MPRNVRSDLGRFLRYLKARGKISRAVRVKSPVEDGTRHTSVRIDDRVPGPPFLGGKARWGVTTVAQFLRATHFANVLPRSEVQVAARKKRGRAVFCVDVRTDEVLAALAFHVDPLRRAPITVTAIAYRTDPDPMAARDTVLCASLLLPYLIEVARQDKRPLEIAFEANSPADVAEAAQIGFRPGAPPPGYTPKSPYYLVWRPY